MVPSYLTLFFSCLASCDWAGEAKNLVSSRRCTDDRTHRESKRKKNVGVRWPCAWTIVSLGLWLTSTFGTLSYKPDSASPKHMVRSASFLRRFHSRSASFFFFMLACNFPTHVICFCDQHFFDLRRCYVARIWRIRCKSKPWGKRMLDGWSGDGGACASFNLW